MELTEKDVYCIARILQGAYYQGDLYYTCRGYCKYSGECFQPEEGHIALHFPALRQKLEKLTGVFLSPIADKAYIRTQMLEGSYFRQAGLELQKKTGENSPVLECLNPS